jgi:uncharacterized protein (TIGR02996 family)
MPRTFELKTQVWSIQRLGAELVIRWGKVGGKQQQSKRTLPTDHEAELELRRQARKKLDAGYQETTPRGAMPKLGQTGEVMVRALEENPDDLATHSGLADWLSEQPDLKLQAWGEFIRVQLRLEDSELPSAERKGLQAREQELQEENQRDWMGESLAGYLLELRTNHLPQYLRDNVGLMRYQFVRGWLDRLFLAWLTPPLAKALTGAAALRLLRRLEVSNLQGKTDLYAHLADSPHLRNLRSVVLSMPPSGGMDFVGNLPRLEEASLCYWRPARIAGLGQMANLASLRSLELRGLVNYPLAELAANPASAGLRRLVLSPLVDEEEELDTPGLEIASLSPLFVPGTFPGLRELSIHCCPAGDEMCGRIAASGLLRRLQALDLSYCNITDEGGLTLAAARDLPRLSSLVLTSNRLGTPGLTALQQTGVAFTAEDQNQFLPDFPGVEMGDEEWE